MGIYDAFDPVDAPVKAAAPPPVHGFGGDTLSAGWKAGQAGTDWGWHQANYENEIRAQIEDELRKRGRDVPHYDVVGAQTGRRLKAAGAQIDPMTQKRMEDADRFWATVAEEKKRDPKFAKQFEGLDDVDSVAKVALARRQQDEDVGGAVYGKSTGMGKAAWWIGNFATGFTDPLSYIPIGGGVTKGATVASRILGTAAREAAINAGAQVALEPLIQVDATKRGQKRGVADVALDVGFAAGLGGLLGGGEAGFHEMFANPKTGHAALDAAVETIGKDRLTPDEKAAVNVLTRELDIKEASPFIASPEGDKAHGSRLATAIASLEADRPVPDFRAQLNSSTTLSREGIIDFVIDAQEGGAKRVVDSGGATRFGISADAHPEVNVDSVGRATAEKIYREQYWAPLGLDNIEPRLAAVAFDAAVNHGPAKAKAMLEESGGSIERMLELRRAEYARLVAENPEKYSRYEKGWENRLAKLEEKIGGVEAGPVLRPELFDDPEAYRLAQAANDGPEKSPFSFPEGGDQRPVREWEGRDADWFAGSKIVDERGEPMKLYHGSGDTIDQWRTDVGGTGVLSFSTDPKFAASYAAAGENPTVYPVNVSAKNVGDFRNPEHIQQVLQIAEQGWNEYVNGWGAGEAKKWSPAERERRHAEFIDEPSIRRGDFHKWEQPEIWDALGWDGAWMREAEGMPGADVVNLAVRKPEQVRHAADVELRRAAVAQKVEDVSPIPASERVVQEAEANQHFTQPQDADAKAQTDSIVHDLTAEVLNGDDVGHYRLTDEGAETTLDEVLASVQADEAAIAAARNCL